MSLREKIIVAVVVLMGAYGLLDFLRRQSRGTDPAEQQSQQAARLQSFIAETRVGLQAGAPTAAERKVLERADHAWERNPFVQESAPENQAAIASAKEPEFRYSGFLSVGEKRLAILNGMEYREGDAVAGAGCVVRCIEPDKVVLVWTNNQATVEVPVEGGGKP
jgi:hypothetical protein